MRLVGLVFGCLILIRMFADRVIVVDVNRGASVLQQVGTATLKGGSTSGTYQAEYDPNSGRLNDR